MEQQYLKILTNILFKGEKTENRTGVATYKVPPKMIQHDMSEGFPILTTKKVAWKTLKVELEGFINGVTSKKWFQDRGCKIWNEWCNPKKVPYDDKPETKEKMLKEDDLGAIYGWQWRNFNAESRDRQSASEMFAANERADIKNPYGVGIDQLKNIVNTLKTNPTDRRMICSSWNPLQLDQMALPPCHYAWQVSVRGNKLDLSWNQRSVDAYLGLPFNITSYGLLLSLLSRESGFEPGTLTGFLMDVHLYENHIDQAIKQLDRNPRNLPTLEFEKWDGIFNWTHKDTNLVGYDPHPAIKAEVAI